MYRYIKAGDGDYEVDKNGVLYTEEEIIGSFEYDARKDIKRVEAPNCKEVRGGAFYECRNLSIAELPNCKEVGEEAFTFCENLQNVDCPNVQKIERQAFLDCHNLKDINLPDNAEIGKGAFYGTPLQDEF